MPITITTFPDQLTASKNDVWVVLNTTDLNALFKMEAYAQPANILIASFIAPADSGNNGSFNLKRILQSMGVAPDVLNYQLPSFNQMAPSLSLNNIKGYSLIFYTLDKTTGTQISNLIYNNNSVVLLAGKSFMQASKKLIDIIGTGTAKRKFLTWQPLEVMTREDSQKYLYYYHNETGISTGAVSISLQVVITLNDKTTVTKIMLPFTISDKQVAIFPAGLSQLNLYSYVTSGKKIVSYTVCLVLSSATTNPITDTYNYTVDIRCFPDRKEFIFLNSLGGMDSLNASSTDETGLELQSEIAERFLSYNYNTQDGQYYNFYKQHYDTNKCTTDLLPLSSRIYLKEFFASTNIWEVTADSFIPVILTDSNYTLNKSVAAVQSIQFAYRYAFDEVAYTP
jgi:hypothetical protein